jgi:hypothetical protein
VPNPVPQIVESVGGLDAGVVEILGGLLLLLERGFDLVGDVAFRAGLILFGLGDVPSRLDSRPRHVPLSTSDVTTRVLSHLRLVLLGVVDGVDRIPDGAGTRLDRRPTPTTTGGLLTHRAQGFADPAHGELEGADRRRRHRDRTRHNQRGVGDGQQDRGEPGNVAERTDRRELPEAVRGVRASADPVAAPARPPHPQGGAGAQAPQATSISRIPPRVSSRTRTRISMSLPDTLRPPPDSQVSR